MSDTPTSAKLVVGDAAPKLVLPDDTGTVRDLADERGRWVVLFFYPKDFTSGCTIEACEFRDSSADFRDAGATVWSISVLDSASKAAFKEKHHLDYPLLADADHDVAERFGVWVEKRKKDGTASMGIARTTFLVDPEGHIATVWSGVKPEGHAADVLAGVGAAAAAT